MPDRYNIFSLTEAAKIIGVPTASLNRMQRETGIWQLGAKGTPVNLTVGDIFVFKRIKIFRAWDVSFKTIKEVHALETDILKEKQRLVKKYTEQFHKGWAVHEMLLHEENFPMIGEDILDAADDDLIIGYFSSDEVQLDCVKYIDLYQEFRNTKKWLAMKREEYLKNTEQLIVVSKEIKL